MPALLTKKRTNVVRAMEEPRFASVVLDELAAERVLDELAAERVHVDASVMSQLRWNGSHGLPPKIVHRVCARGNECMRRNTIALQVTAP